MQEVKKKKPEEKPDMVKHIQEMSERQRKADEEKKKKKASGVDTAPSPGIFDRLYEFVVGPKEKKKK